VDQSILIPTERLTIRALERFRNAPFETMIKFVVDVRLGKIALGGEMHGGNLWPWEQPPRIEYISLINVRPSAGNRGMDIMMDDIRSAVKAAVHTWVDLP
jgi:hypothetical protein